MITGMISVCDHDAYALVDPGATHSFISVPFTERHQIESHPIDGRMVVFVPNEDCHAPNPGPTGLADPNRVRGARLRTGTLYLFFFFFLKNRTGTCGYDPHL